MEYKALKSELIEWLTKLEDEDTLDYLKIVKDANVTPDDWGHDLTEEQILGIERGLKDVEEDRVTPHGTIREKYGL